MNPHAYIYSFDGMSTGVLGWILQDSPSYKTEFFQMDSASLYQKEISHDPWDNHGDNEKHWSHKYIKNLEVKNDDFSWFDNFVDSFPGPGIFGLSYGSYQKTSVWKKPNVKVLLSTPLDDSSKAKYKTMFIETYWKRKLDVEDLVESVDMHTHDHKEDCSVYKFTLLGRIQRAIDLAKERQLEFWQLQMIYHHEYDHVPEQTEEEYTKLYALYDEEVHSETSLLHNDKDVIKADLFNLDLKELCTQLQIEYCEEMEHNYNQFLDWFHRFEK